MGFNRVYFLGYAEVRSVKQRANKLSADFKNASSWNTMENAGIIFEHLRVKDMCSTLWSLFEFGIICGPSITMVHLLTQTLWEVTLNKWMEGKQSKWGCWYFHSAWPQMELALAKMIFCSASGGQPLSTCLVPHLLTSQHPICSLLSKWNYSLIKLLCHVRCLKITLSLARDVEFDKCNILLWHACFDPELVL